MGEANELPVPYLLIHEGAYFFYADGEELFVTTDLLMGIITVMGAYWMMDAAKRPPSYIIPAGHRPIILWHTKRETATEYPERCNKEVKI